MSLNDRRRDPFAELDDDVPLAPGSEVVPQVLATPPRTREKRKHKRRPTERRRRKRKLGVVFSSTNANVPRRIRQLAKRWGISSNSGRVGVSQVSEYLLLSHLRAAEDGTLQAPTDGQHNDATSDIGVQQRRLHITFSVTHKDVPERLRNLAERWNLYTNNGYPAVSRVCEYLLVPSLEAAERGEIPPLKTGTEGVEPMRAKRNTLDQVWS